MADDKPMRFNSPQPRDPSGQFARMPESPAEVLEEGGRPDKWSPGIGVGTAPGARGKIPWPPAKQPPTPYRGLSSGRK